MKRTFQVLLIAVVVLVVAIYGYRRLTEPPKDPNANWSVGIYSGSSPVDLKPDPSIPAPVLRASDLGDKNIKFLADPFMVSETNRWFLFFEVYNRTNEQAGLGFASSDDLKTWTYGGLVIQEPFHLSYPYVFKVKETYYMIPESRQSKAIRLYRADHFPDKWSFEKDLIKGEYSDPCFFEYDGKFWIFAKHAPAYMYVFYADQLTGPWKEHKQNPVIWYNSHTSRGGGRIISYNNKIIRFAQDGAPRYGTSVLAIEVTKLTPTEYEEKPYQEKPVVTASGAGWNKYGMHTVDPHEIAPGKWVSCVDGMGL